MTVPLIARLKHNAFGAVRPLRHPEWRTAAAVVFTHHRASGYALGSRRSDGGNGVMRTAYSRISDKVTNLAAHGRHRLSQLRHLGKAPPLSALGRRIEWEMQSEGVSVVSLKELDFASNDVFSDAIRQTKAELERLNAEARAGLDYASGFEHCTPISPKKVAQEFPGLYTWGLDSGLLDIVENLLGMPAAYHGVCARQEIVDGKESGTRLWHQDTEDIKIIRVLIYLSDVTCDDDGPFEYVPKRQAVSYRDFRGIDDISDADMARVVPPDLWRRVLGPAGTVIFGDGANLFHHGKRPLSARQVCSFCYTSRHPTNPQLCREYSFESGIPHLRVELSERQRACLWQYERLLPCGEGTRSLGQVPTALS